MTKYMILSDSESQKNPEYKTRELNYNPIEAFIHSPGSAMRMPLEGLVLEDGAVGTKEELYEQARYIVSVDLRNQWTIRRNYSERRESIKPVDPKTIRAIEEVYGSEGEYRAEIRRFLREEFLKLFLPFLEDSALVYSPYSGYEGGIDSLGAEGKIRGTLLDEMVLGAFQMPTSRVLRAIGGAQFYVSEDEFSFKCNRDSWQATPELHISRKARESDEYEHKFIESTKVKFMSNPLISFSHSPNSFQRFVEMLRRGPKGTTFAIGTTIEKTLLNPLALLKTTRFFKDDDPVYMAFEDYLSMTKTKKVNLRGVQRGIEIMMIDESHVTPPMIERIEMAIANLKDRNMLMHDPDLIEQFNEREVLELYDDIRRRMGLKG